MEAMFYHLLMLMIERKILTRFDIDKHPLPIRQTNPEGHDNLLFTNGGVIFFTASMVKTIRFDSLGAYVKFH